MSNEKTLNIVVKSDFDDKISGIVIRGERGTGKTVFSEILRRIFTELGAQVVVSDDDGPQRRFVHQQRSPRGVQHDFTGHAVGIHVVNDE